MRKWNQKYIWKRSNCVWIVAATCWFVCFIECNVSIFIFNCVTFYGLMSPLEVDATVQIINTYFLCSSEFTVFVCIVLSCCYSVQKINMLFILFPVYLFINSNFFLYFDNFDVLNWMDQNFVVVVVVFVFNLSHKAADSLKN